MHLLTLHDLGKEAVAELIDRAIELKRRHKRGIPYRPLVGKTLLLLFEKPSTRTRISFEVAMTQLGGSTIFVTSQDTQLGRGEPIKDTARVVSRYVDSVVIRTHEHERIEEFARHSRVPVINGLTKTHHPCQVLADIMTVVEKKGTYENLKIVWIGDGNNMANSWIEIAGLLGLRLTLSCPDGFMPDEGLVEVARKEGAEIEFAETPEEAIKGADVVNTDVWTSMGDEEEKEKREKAFKGYQINDTLLELANPDCIVMHCLPAHRGEEITDSVIEGSNSVVWDEAENRLHMQKAILERLLTGEGKQT